MTLNVANLNMRELKDSSKSAHLLGELLNLWVNVTAVQETHFICPDDCQVLESNIVVFSAFGSRCSAGVSLLVGCSLNAIVNLVFADDRGLVVVADVSIKSFEFRVVAVYVPNSVGDRHSFLWWLGPFLDDSKWLLLMDDWNAILDPKLDKDRRGASGSDRWESSLINLLVEFDLVDRFRLDYPGQEMWTWLGDSPTGQVRSYLDRVLEELTVTSLLVPHSTG